MPLCCPLLDSGSLGVGLSLHCLPLCSGSGTAGPGTQESRKNDILTNGSRVSQQTEAFLPYVKQTQSLDAGPIVDSWDQKAFSVNLPLLPNSRVTLANLLSLGFLIHKKG